MRPILKIYDEQGNEIPIPAIQGPPGPKGDPAVVDQIYDSQSANAQSGIAVAEAINTTVGSIEVALDNIIAIQEGYIANDPYPTSLEVNG